MNAVLKQVVDESPGVRSFRLETTSGDLTYKPGQWLYVTLPALSYPDERGARRHFTISSSPTEQYLQFTTKLSESGFKKTLWEKKEGDELEVRGAFGSFFLDPSDTSPRVFLAGGIGITPFRSMIRYIEDTESTIPVTLIYSAKTPEELIFFKTLEESHRVKTVFTITEEAGDDGWSRERGRISPEMITAHVPDWKSQTFWVCGPPTMVAALTDMVSDMGLPAEQVRSEEFIGY